MEFKVAIDTYMSNSALLCDVVLPDATWLEQSQIKTDWLYDAFISYYAEVVKPMYESRPIWAITTRLAQRLGLGKYFPWTDIEEALRTQVAGTPWSFDELKEKGFIVIAGKLPIKYFEEKYYGLGV